MNTAQLSKDLQYVSKRLRQLRYVAKLSQYEMAEMIGVNHNTVSRLETEQRIPDLEQLFRYCYALNRPVTDFLPYYLQTLGQEQSAAMEMYIQLTESQKEIVRATLIALIASLLEQQSTLD